MPQEKRNSLHAKKPLIRWSVSASAEILTGWEGARRFIQMPTKNTVIWTNWFSAGILQCHWPYTKFQQATTRKNYIPDKDVKNSQQNSSKLKSTAY